MPLYTIHNNTSGEETEEMMSYDALIQYLEENPHLTQRPTKSSLGDPIRLGLVKPPTEFRNLLSKMNRNAGRGSKINTF